jgi:membrane fusion protein (multidrug efflux system)
MSSTVLARDTVSQPAKTTNTGASLRRLALTGGAVAIIAGGSWYGHDWWTNGRYIQTTDDAYVGGNVTTIAPHIPGFVQDVLIEDNQPVHAGQLLVRLDPRDYQAALDHAQAVVAARMAKLESLRAQYPRQQAAIRQQEADLAAKSARALFAAQDAERYRTLALTAAGSRQDAQKGTALDQEARSAVASAAASLDAAQQQLKVLDADISEATAAVAQARSDTEIARLNLGYTEIRAPIDGYIGNRAAQVGAYVAAGAYLISVIPSAGLWVDANFKEDQLAHMAAGEGATVAADVLPGHAFRGRVASIAPGTGAVFSVIPPENATGNFTKIVQRVPVRVLLDAADQTLPLLRPGLSATVSVDTRTARSEAQ